MLNAVWTLQQRDFGLNERQRKLRQKAFAIVGEFGPELIITPLPQLKLMADMACETGDYGNIFNRIWNRHHFMITADMLKAMGGTEFPRLLELINLLESIWDFPDRISRPINQA